MQKKRFNMQNNTVLICEKTVLICHKKCFQTAQTFENSFKTTKMWNRFENNAKRSVCTRKAKVSTAKTKRFNLQKEAF